jgi:hypothetical protein
MCMITYDAASTAPIKEKLSYMYSRVASTAACCCLISIISCMVRSGTDIIESRGLDRLLPKLEHTVARR